MSTPYWQLSVHEVIEKLSTHPESGLSANDVSSRHIQFGPNELIEKKQKTVLTLLLDQFKDFMILVLIAVAIIAGTIGDASDTIVIIVIVILNASIGFIQEWRAEKAMLMLKKMAAQHAVAIRNGRHTQMPASQLVPGDLVVLEAGNVVPADIRLTEAAQLKINESALTGESVSSEKMTLPLEDPNLSIGDRKNMVYKGTVIQYGRAKGIVTATGMNTEIGKIAALLQEEEESQTPLQKRLAAFGQKLALVVLGICGVVFGVGILRGEEPVLMFLTAMSLAVAAIPEALPAVITLSLAFGARKMIQQNTLIRKLSAVETLGSVTTICSDKTGTLTLNQMTVEKIHAPNSAYPDLLTALALNNDVTEDSVHTLLGDSTEVALYLASQKKGFDKKTLEKTLPRIAEIPFDSHRKCMTTFHQNQDGRVTSFTKGATDFLLNKMIPETDRGAIQNEAEKMAKDGLRVLCMTIKNWDRLPKNLTSEATENNLAFLGLVGLIDPPREEAKDAIHLCKTAGITPVMITGDHPLTATVIAKKLGILEHNTNAVITGIQLEQLSLDEFEQQVEHIRVYARVTPEQKLKIVKALQDKGQFVAMTGDGVNDAPAIKRADIGIAMGITGTDVSKEAAHMILLDDNFATIVKAVKEGRRIFDNIRKFIQYTMTSNSGEIWTIFLAPFLGLPIPLLPIHILWINLVTDGLPGLALASEPAEKTIMNRPPRPPKQSIFASGLGIHIIWVGLLMGAVCLLTQAWAIQSGSAHWQTMVFTVLCLSQMGHVLAIRSGRESVFTQGLFSNKPLIGALALTFLIQMATIYIPVLNPIFKTEPLSLRELGIALALSSVVFFAVEIEKWIKRLRQSTPESK